ncbi:MAG: hypothetical protein MHPSP_002362 [Paramarteilia canceri]
MDKAQEGLGDVFEELNELIKYDSLSTDDKIKYDDFSRKYVKFFSEIDKFIKKNLRVVDEEELRSWCDRFNILLQYCSSFEGYDTCKWIVYFLKYIPSIARGKFRGKIFTKETEMNLEKFFEFYTFMLNKLDIELKKNQEDLKSKIEKINLGPDLKDSLKKATRIYNDLIKELVNKILLEDQKSSGASKSEETKI